MRPAIDTPLAKALRRHREDHGNCSRHCREYLSIAQRATDERKMHEGRLNVAYTWLSVREAENV